MAHCPRLPSQGRSLHSPRAWGLLCSERFSKKLKWQHLRQQIRSSGVCAVCGLVLAAIIFSNKDSTVLIVRMSVCLTFLPHQAQYQPQGFVIKGIESAPIGRNGSASATGTISLLSIGAGLGPTIGLETANPQAHRAG